MFLLFVIHTCSERGNGDAVLAVQRYIAVICPEVTYIRRLLYFICVDAYRSVLVYNCAGRLVFLICACNLKAGYAVVALYIKAALCVVKADNSSVPWLSRYM